MTDNNEAVQAQAETNVPSLSLSDLVSARNIAKIAVDGKFFKRGDEAKFVEDVYNKFNDFVTYADMMNKKAEADAETKKAETPAV